MFAIGKKAKNQGLQTKKIEKKQCKNPPKYTENNQNPKNRHNKSLAYEAEMLYECYFSFVGLGAIFKITKNLIFI